MSRTPREIAREIRTLLDNTGRRYSKVAVIPDALFKEAATAIQESDFRLGIPSISNNEFFIDCKTMIISETEASKRLAGFHNLPLVSDGIRSLLNEVVDEIERAIEQHGGYNSAHEAYGVLAEEVDEFWEEVRKKRKDRSKEDMRKELIQIAAVAVKAAHCLCEE
jgi:NTP pyrophosphatase (non-canonical NTP hydrolase)